MNELIICIVFIPFIFLGGNKKAGEGPLWIPAALALGCVSYFVWQRSENPLWWGGVAAFLALTLSEVIEAKKLKPITAFASLFFAQSLISRDIGITIICIVMGDLFLNLETFLAGDLSEKNRAIHNICRSLFSLLPASFGVLLHLEGHYLILALALTIVLRLFAWPLPHWVSEKETESPYSYLLAAAIPSFALWHNQDFSSYPLWALVWMALAAVLSLGAQYSEVYIAMGLGVFCISPVHGLMAIALWPLLLHKSKVMYLVALFAGIGGVLISDFSIKALNENAVYAIEVLSAILLSRPFVSAKIIVRPWFVDAIDIALTALLLGLFIFVLPAQIPVVGLQGIIFAGVFLISVILGKVLYPKRKRFFEPINGFTGNLWPEIKDPIALLQERAGKQIDLSEGRRLRKFYDAIESESHLVWLLGLLGLALAWGLR